MRRIITPIRRTSARSASRRAGTLRLMLGMTAPADGLEGDADKDGPDSRINAVVNYFGPTDLAAKDIPDISKPLVRDFLGGVPSEKPEEAKKASPLTFVSKDDAPVLTFQGTKIRSSRTPRRRSSPTR